jgi:DNA polymerase-3 subunit gamma/tau
VVPPGRHFFLMSYLVLARKYRPRQFTELVGQQHVATTLLNAFKQNKLGQAYLFTGTRGVGKTSVARIFAKALRCEDKDSLPGGKNRGVSCDKCPSCLEINSGSSIDVLEIDGASNNGVENVREIREQVKFLPSRGAMKVYIIDEVHMLSNAAFNALLKTLEEPPAHVTFILATTEVQKIPATILSRCQRFDFKRVPQLSILEHLNRLLRLEGIQAEAESVRLIARKADGSVRDALSAMDQCLAMAGKELSVKNVTEALGIVSNSFLLKVLHHSFHRELAKAAELVKDAFHNGVEMRLLAVGLAETLRNALFVKLNASPSVTELSEEERTEYEALVKTLSAETIQAAYRSLIASLDEILRSPLPRASLEMALARISGIGHLKSLEELVRGSAEGKLALNTEKKSPEPVNIAPSPLPQVTQSSQTAHEAATFSGFIQSVIQEKANLGALLEHAIVTTPENSWGSASEIKLGFRKSHSFFQAQAQNKQNAEPLEKILQSYLGKKVLLRFETLPDETTEKVSLVETQTRVVAQVADDKKKRFLEHEVVRHTKEIFGAEMSSFDIDKSKI